eukprot:COSAG01_NODE_41107_length_455_cov_6.261236_1_plen_100_part_10
MVQDKARAVELWADMDWVMDGVCNGTVGMEYFMMLGEIEHSCFFRTQPAAGRPYPQFAYYRLRAPPWAAPTAAALVGAGRLCSVGETQRTPPACAATQQH